MIEIKRLDSLVLLALCAAAPALAQIQTQTQSQTQTQPQTQTQTQTQTQPRGFTQSVKAPAPLQPYTVEFKTTHVQTLANGTTISTEVKELVARDKDGRRMDSTTNPPSASRPAITNVHVSDPTTGDEIHWDSLSKVAHDVRRPVGAARQGCWATPNGRYRANYGHSNAGAQPQPSQPLPPPAPAATSVAAPQAQNNRVPGLPDTVTGPDGKNIVVVGVKPTLVIAAPASSTDGNTVHEDLGAENILGVEVRGSRTTVTTPAGAAGNDQPLVHTDEYWMAPSLGMALRSITVDPRMGKTQREAVSVDLTNPNPSLFHPPAGYQLETEAMQPVDCQR